MPPFSVRYGFTQKFSVPPRDAYNWCTDYSPNDWALMGKQGKRKIRKISDDTVILDDTVYRDRKPVTKRRLVRLDPVRLSWSNTHLTGQNKHSQFLYKITAEGDRGSKLEFIGLHLEYAETKPTRERIASMARSYRDEDAESWRSLARAMEKDLGGR